MITDFPFIGIDEIKSYLSCLIKLRSKVEIAEEILRIGDKTEDISKSFKFNIKYMIQIENDSTFCVS